jgi:hypothetical protein
MIWAGVIPAQGPASMQRATRPATWGEAIDVPDSVLVSPSFQVEVMQTPGAAMVWSRLWLVCLVHLIRTAMVG